MKTIITEATSEMVNCRVRFLRQYKTSPKAFNSTPKDAEAVITALHHNDAVRDGVYVRVDGKSGELWVPVSYLELIG